MSILTIPGRLRRAIFCLTVAIPALAGAASTDLATAPLVTSSTSAVLPNIFLMMDDSGSMGWDFMPDSGDSKTTPPYYIFFQTTYGAASAQCNGVFYNPAIIYTAPVTNTGASYPAASFTGAWMDGYNPGAGTVNLSNAFQISRNQTDTSAAPSTKADVYTAAKPYPAAGAPAFYYLYTGAQTSATAKKFYTTSSTFYTECNAAAGNLGTSITVGGTGSTSIASITVGTSPLVTIASGILAQGSTNALAAAIAASITANNGSTGYSASSNNSKVTIIGPPGAAGKTPVVTKTGSMTLALSAFPATSATFTLVPVTSTSGTGGTDERGNFANWYSYYRTRVNMMKSGSGLAFNSLNQNYRVGFATMNNNGGTDMVNLAPFTAAQKTAWYSKLYGVTAGSGTPLLSALSNVGLMYANKLPVSRGAHTLNGVTVTDPVQYSCQQNFAILSTDGFWNDATDSNLSGGSVGEQDGSATTPRPYCDGAAACGGYGSSGSGTSDTLADVAMYYYMNDLRTSALSNCTGSLGLNVCLDNVPTNAQDTASWHHMTLFTVGLGAPGRMVFDPTYQNETSSSAIRDYFNVAQGVLASSTVCTWGTSGKPCEWPTPDPAGKPENIDDLWHAAVNGRGAYFSATDPNALATGLTNALNSVTQILSSSAAATTSSPNVTSASDFVFSSTYTSALWDGELSEQTLDPTTGMLTGTTVWTAAAQLDTVPFTARKVYFNKSNVLTPLTWANLPAAQQAYFNTPNISTLSQFCSLGAICLSAANQTAATGSPLLNFILGDRTNEGLLSTQYYRVRTHVLGDIVDAQAAYVGASLFNYADVGYSSFATANVSRAGAVYTASNDGMLHAFNSTTGAEMWAYVPTAVMPSLFNMADKNYVTLHQFSVDGTPTVGDAYFGGAWHTILVGGLNEGGASYYALDVTNPTTPIVLWEFTDTNLGYTYGNPVITKLKNGTWVVLVASGYNNADGLGHLYVLNAQTGGVGIISNVNTGVGSAGSPSGLSRISAWVNNPMVDNTAQRVYAGDLLGNVWRFDVNGPTGSGASPSAPQLLATLKDGSGIIQPITAKPELGTVKGNAVVFVGTGRYLGVTDLSNTSQQSFYAIKDTLGTATYTNPRSYGGFIQQTEVDGTCPSTAPASVCGTGTLVRTSSANAVSFAINNGWFIDFPDSGERDNTDPILVLGTLAFNTNIPNVTACTAGGYSYQYFLDYSSGAPLATSGTVVAVSLGNSLATSPSVVQLSNGLLVAITTLSKGTEKTTGLLVNSSTTTTRRVGWHELSN